MKKNRSVEWLWVLALVSLAAVVGTSSVQAQWLQWGGPNRDFKVEAGGLADSWPEQGPPRLWHRPLGDGYSTILVDNGVLYTMYANETEQHTIALDARTGKTIWDYTHDSLFKGTDFGPGPHSTPLISGNRLYAVTANAVFQCFDKRSGKLLWKHDLAAEFGAPVAHFGYSPSPVAHKNLIILPVDRKREGQPGGRPESADSKDKQKENVVAQSLMAFDQTSGSVVWRSQDFPIDYSSPIIINRDGVDQVVLFMRKEVMGVDPNNGDLLWHRECLPSPMENISTPIWDGDDLLFFSAAYDSGSRVIKLGGESAKPTTEELWYSRKLRILHGNAILLGDHVYGSSGDFGAFLFTCMNIRTGKAEWRERGLKKANSVYADGKLIILDEDGHLALATVSPKGMKIHSKCKVAEFQAWATPTLVGTTLYVRDRKHIMAFDLG
jgi:outer membrane protein assembly factor BamB